MEPNFLQILGGIIALIGLLWNRIIDREFKQERFEKWQKKWLTRHPDYHDEIVAKELKEYGMRGAPLYPPERDEYVKSQKIQEKTSFVMMVIGSILTVLGFFV